jgi:hypothetical protein
MKFSMDVSACCNSQNMRFLKINALEASSYVSAVMNVNSMLYISFRFE